MLKPCDEDIIWYPVMLPPYIRAIVVYEEIWSINECQTYVVLSLVK